MISISPKQVLSLAPAALPVYRQAFKDADRVLERYGINATGLRVAHFMAQVLHETGALTILTESMNYAAGMLIPTFGRSRIPDELAEKYGRTSRHAADQEAIANTVYGGEWGRKNLGNVEPDDGWKFRGAGLLQMTGRDARKRIGDALGIDLINQPWLAVDATFLLPIACEEWAEKGCNLLADIDDIVKLTKRINGGDIGLQSRRDWLTKTKAMWL